MAYSFCMVHEGPLLRQSYRLRHHVYASEKGWLGESEDGLEIDKWDPHSEHYVALDEGGAVVGTARMVFDSKRGFPYEEATHQSLPEEIDRQATYEVSRLAVLPEARGDRSAVLVGLTRAIWRSGERCHMQHWCAVIDKPVLRLLKMLGFVFTHELSGVEHVGSISIPVICDCSVAGGILFTDRIDQLLDANIEDAYE